ncbi:hypothetical protein HN592_02885 [Candidatus Woesearchaeota archaeon]|jgi:small subunit ribosomal protein S24e|nr:hypothetical protein [Candidatus Woesearchaeota archaeon]MBT4368158.1 hypothetical protein [Candidatus Woesearchaeota archaeon]MBT4712646.1 hypothetical protein [Candidatus Woesearchaeota archaeon]MBT6639559.1 hypothetical protein [Candidatus Woesearchaeota archaeon]MBT7133731.1 hypothetical protein [Candidatus Woesearchaeota archaeon]
MNILNKKETNNELLGRKEYRLDMSFEGAVPSKEAVKKELCSQLKCKEDLSVVREIIPKFKSNIASVEILAYNKKEDLERIEGYLMHKKIEEKLKKAEEAAAKPAEPATEAKPAEEKAEEKPAEEPAKEEAKGDE